MIRKSVNCIKYIDSILRYHHVYIRMYKIQVEIRSFGREGWTISSHNVAIIHINRPIEESLTISVCMVTHPEGIVGVTIATNYVVIMLYKRLEHIQILR